MLCNVLRYSIIEPYMRPTPHNAHDHGIIKGDLLLNTGLEVREPCEPVRDISFWSAWTHSLPVGAKIGGEEVIGEVEIAGSPLCKPAAGKHCICFSGHPILS